MTINADVVKDSVGPTGVRLTTFLLTYPRMVHCEVLTHRMLSRNASSSRAIPAETQIKAIEEDMAMPLEFRKNQKGMQAAEPLDQRGQNACRHIWTEAGKKAVAFARDLHLWGVHKQYVNRISESFQHITVVCTATEFANFFALRYHAMAQPEIAELAKRMWEAYQASTPILRQVGQWHLPFVSEAEIEAAQYSVDPEAVVQALIRKSVACCARTSYKNHFKAEATQEENDDLYRRLLSKPPIHASPAEHQACVMGPNDPHSLIFEGYENGDKTKPIYSRFSGNFREWNQYRKSLANENITSFDGPLT